MKLIKLIWVEEEREGCVGWGGGGVSDDGGGGGGGLEYDGV